VPVLSCKNSHGLNWTSEWQLETDYVEGNDDDGDDDEDEMRDSGGGCGQNFYFIFENGDKRFGFFEKILLPCDGNRSTHSSNFVCARNECRVLKDRSNDEEGGRRRKGGLRWIVPSDGGMRPR
jgi:hypothetical protein